MITDLYQRVPCKDILIDRESRQRKTIDTKGLKDSIAQRGVLQPIIITREFQLVAGERRLTASLELGLPTIPCRFIEDLSLTEAAIVELEENLKRSDLSWQDTAAAIYKLHHLYLAADDGWTHAKTASVIGIDTSGVTRYLRVSDGLDNPNILRQASIETAYNMLKRADERRAGDALSDILAVSHIKIKPEEQNDDLSAETANDNPASQVAAPVPPASSLPFLLTSFEDWLESYTGAPFNFLHCDFPYGVNVFDGEYGAISGEKHYSDTPEDYFHLIQLLAKNLDRVLSHSSHLMFWFSMEHYEATFSEFRRQMPDVVWQKFPLLWVKSDNVGIMPDPKRGPRRIYETCLVGTRGDRPVVKPISNAYSCPTDKRFHPSTKPEPMLRHFMQMFVDNGTRMLDPTCGGGSALRAAITLGAEQVLGLEQDQGHYDQACSAFATFTKLRNI